MMWGPARGGLRSPRINFSMRFLLRNGRPAESLQNILFPRQQTGYHNKNPASRGNISPQPPYYFIFHNLLPGSQFILGGYFAEPATKKKKRKLAARVDGWPRHRAQSDAAPGRSGAHEHDRSTRGAERGGEGRSKGGVAFPNRPPPLRWRIWTAEKSTAVGPSRRVGLPFCRG